MEKRGGAKKRKTWIINVYDNYFQPDQVWGEMSSTSRRPAIADASCGSLIESRVILLGDFNAHGPEWNLPCGEKRNTADLKALIERYSLILNKQPGEATRHTQRSTTSIIDHTFTRLEVVVRNTWMIDGELYIP